MLQYYTLMFRRYSYGPPIYISSQRRYITMLHYMSVPTSTAPTKGFAHTANDF